MNMPSIHSYVIVYNAKITVEQMECLLRTKAGDPVLKYTSKRRREDCSSGESEGGDENMTRISII